MAIRPAVNIRSGAAEKAKYITPGRIDEIWSCALPVGVAAGDTVTGPVIPANTYLCEMMVDSAALGAGLTFTVGYTGTPAAFFASSTIAAAGGVATNTAPGSVGYTSTSDTQVIITFGGTTSTSAGSFRIMCSYTANP